MLATEGHFCITQPCDYITQRLRRNMKSMCSLAISSSCNIKTSKPDPHPGCVCSVIATKAAVPLVYVPLEGVSSKW